MLEIETVGVSALPAAAEVVAAFLAALDSGSEDEAPQAASDAPAKKSVATCGGARPSARAAPRFGS